MRHAISLWAAALAALVALVVPAGAARDAGQPTGWKALLIAADDEEPAFDNAVDAMTKKLVGFGVARRNIAVLKASADGAAAATTQNITAAFGALDPGPRDGCFVFITSHGVPGHGLFLSDQRRALTPRTLARLLDGGCGRHQSVVILSGCFSGIYVTDSPVPAPNRVILTAARIDRPSFGCNAGLKYTFFDKCLLDGLDRRRTWRQVMDKTRACVSGNEFDLHIRAPSEPQLSVGDAEARLRVFSR